MKNVHELPSPQAYFKIIPYFIMKTVSFARTERKCQIKKHKDSIKFKRSHWELRKIEL